MNVSECFAVPQLSQSDECQHIGQVKHASTAELIRALIYAPQLPWSARSSPVSSAPSEAYRSLFHLILDRHQREVLHALDAWQSSSSITISDSSSSDSESLLTQSRPSVTAQLLHHLVKNHLANLLTHITALSAAPDTWWLNAMWTSVTTISQIVLDLSQSFSSPALPTSFFTTVSAPAAASRPQIPPAHQRALSHILASSLIGVILPEVFTALVRFPSES